MKKGYLISLEGPDGAGKTTQLTCLGEKAEACGINVLYTREPGGTPVGDAVRKILLDPVFGEMVPLTEVFLYAAARAQLYHQRVGPALETGRLILCDRFIDSTLAYQAYGGKLDFDFVLQTNLKAVQDRLPDKTFILDIDPACALARRSVLMADRVEQKPLEYHNRVRDGFLALAHTYPERIVVVDGTMPEEKLASIIWEHVREDLERLR
jgi:dTMP kinase